MIRFGPSHQMSTRLLALLGAASLALTGEVSAPLLTLLGLAFAISFAGVRRPFRLPIPRSFWNAVTIGMFAFAVLDVLWISKSLLMGSIHFLIYLTILKLLTLETSRDHLQLTLISFLHLMASSTLTTEFFYAVIFLFYLIAAIWTLLLFNLRAGAEAQGRPEALEDLDRERVLKTPFILVTTAVGLFSFMLTFVIFFIIPRIGIGFMQKKPSEPIRTVGFSEKVNLGAMGSVKTDPTIVMRVTIPGRDRMLGEGLYYRGVTFDAYDGKSWKNDREGHASLPRDAGGRYGIAHLVRASGEPFVQEIALEPLDTPIIFAASQVQSVAGGGGGLFGLTIDGAESLRVPVAPMRPMEYSVTSRIPRLSEDEMREASFKYPSEIISRYLQLPEGEDALRRLAADVARDAATPYEKIRLIQRRLLTRYRYTLDVTSTPGVPPIDDFLFYRKTGFCEHYATAMTLMLRSLGIPARLATGFYGGEWNEFGNYYTISKSDAHAWVEVYFPQAGWVTFDPTPSDSGSSRLVGFSALSRYVDAMRQKWKRYIIDYDIDDQVRVAEQVRTKGLNLREALQKAGAAVKAVWEEIVREAGRRTGLVRGILTALALAGLLLWLYLIRTRGRVAGIFPRGPLHGDRVAGLYLQILRILSTRGLPKPQQMTPREFIPQVESAIPVSPERLLYATDAYYAIRFGGVPATPEMEGEMLAILQAIKGAA